MQINLSGDDLSPLIRRIVAEVFEQLQLDQARLGPALTLSESEAAATLGIPRHVLRDLRQRGEAHAVRLGKSYRYSREEILRLAGIARAQ